MGRVKNMAWDNAETKVDEVLSKMKDGQIDWDTARTDILKVNNVGLTGIDDNNVDEVMSENTKEDKFDPNGLPKDFSDKYHL